MEKFNEDDGVWRTIRGRRVFIRDGESVESAMSRSGKFKSMSRVEKNKDKYNTIDEYRKRKATNKFEEPEPKKKDLSKRTPKEEQFGKKISYLDKRGNTYIPVREGEEREYEKNIEQEREEFYDKYAKFYGEEYATRGKHEDGVYYALGDDEVKKELREKLDPKYEEKGEITKEDVKEVIENYKKRKQSNIGSATTFTGTEEEKLKQEKEYIEKQMRNLESGNIFSVRDNTGNQKNYLMSDKNYMSSQEKKKYYELQERRDEIIRKLKKNH